MKIPFITKHYSGSYIGGILDTYQRAGIFVQAVQFLAIIIIFYTTSAQSIITKYTPWLNFGLYLLIVVIGVLLLMILVRLLVIPSAYTFLNQQMWKNNNPMREKLELIEANQAAIEASQEKIMRRLGIKDEE